MKLRVLIGILVFLIIVNLATIGTFLFVQFTRRPAVPPDWKDFGPGMHSQHGKHSEIREHMHFRNEEREKLITLLHEFRNETQELRDHVRDLERSAFELIQKDPAPRAQIDSLLKEISQTEYEISAIAATRLIEAKKILPPEQQKHFFNAIHRWHMRTRGEVRQPRMGRGQKRWRKPLPPDSVGQ
ncbi:MAG: periplasmic heavy metal sensor [Candidatus Latescibacterota bacterium]|nr:MAG: periplasmic heavy metal sensor [Candidatus Latescibacterota bacterium]